MEFIVKPPWQATTLFVGAILSAVSKGLMGISMLMLGALFKLIGKGAEFAAERAEAERALEMEGVDVSLQFIINLMEKFSVVLAVFFLALTVFFIFISVALKRRKKWAVIASLVLYSLMFLLNFATIAFMGFSIVPILMAVAYGGMFYCSVVMLKDSYYNPQAMTTFEY